MLVRVALGRAQFVLERHHAGLLRPSMRVFQHVPADREQPRAKAALAAERAHRSERPDERLLHHVIEIRLRCPGAREEARQRARMTPDQFGRRPLVTALPGGDQRRVGRARDGGDGLRGSHSCRDGRRGRYGEIKTTMAAKAAGAAERLRAALAARAALAYLPNSNDRSNYAPLRRAAGPLPLPG